MPTRGSGETTGQIASGVSFEEVVLEVFSLNLLFSKQLFWAV